MIEITESQFEKLMEIPEAKFILENNIEYEKHKIYLLVYRYSNSVKFYKLHRVTDNDEYAWTSLQNSNCWSDGKFSIEKIDDYLNDDQFEIHIFDSLTEYCGFILKNIKND